MRCYVQACFLTSALQPVIIWIILIQSLVWVFSVSIAFALCSVVII